MENNKNSNNKLGKAIPFVIFENGKFIICDEAKKTLKSTKAKNIGIISLVGKYRSGKSFLLNRVLINKVQSPGFKVAASIRPCTKGIWLWTEPIEIQNTHCTEPFPCFLIDTEGLGAYDEEVNHDSKIFLIAVLISSLFIYNSLETINEVEIQNLGFIVNLRKTIKIHNTLSDNNDAELAEYFPSLLWLLRDFSLALEDSNGNVITEKQYLEFALRNLKGSSDSIEKKNEIRTLIRTVFPERDLFTMVRPVHDESEIQKLQELPDEKLRKEFVEQAKNFRNKVYKRIKPKQLMNKNLNGGMLIEFIQSVIDCINGGLVPVIENSWKYVMHNECIKHMERIVKDFTDEINKYRNDNINNPNYAKKINSYLKATYTKYIDTFIKNDILDEENKDEYKKRISLKLDEILKRFNKEKEKYFEGQFNKELDIQTEEFIKNIEINDKYITNYYLIFENIDNFKRHLESFTPPFPLKNDILFDRIMQIIKRFIDILFIKTKLKYEQENTKNKSTIAQYQENIKSLNNDLFNKNKKMLESECTLNLQIQSEKLKQKEIENKLILLEKENKNIKDSYEKSISKITKEKEYIIIQFDKIKAKYENDLNSKNEELLIIKLNNEKNKSLYTQQISFLQKEIANSKDIIENIKKEQMNLLKQNSILQQQNQNLISQSKQAEENNKQMLNKNMNQFLNIIDTKIKNQNEENKSIMQKLLSMQKEKEESNEREIKLLSNVKETSLKNQELTLSLTTKDSKIKQLEEQINKLNLYKEIIHNTMSYKCKICFKYFPFDEFKNHYTQCVNSNSLNNQNAEGEEIILLEKFKLKILKGKIKLDEFGKPYLEYIIDLCYQDNKWKIKKTFNQFVNLYKSIKSMLKDKIVMPSSCIILTNINNISESNNIQNNSFHESKITQLEKFIKDLLSIEEINKMKVIRRFLGMDKILLEGEEEEQ